MLHRYPDFYRQFHCLADQCPDSCCADWAVVVDEASARRYRHLPGILGDKLRQVMETDEDGDLIFRLEEGRCPFWDTDGLCRIQRELGEEGLCETCHRFPRLTQDYGSFIEHGLTLACPEAARLILCHSGPRQVMAVTDDLPEEVTGLDEEVLEELQAARQVLLEELWAGNCRETDALAVCLMHIQWFQDCFDGFAPGAWNRELALTQADSVPSRGELPWRLIQLHRELEILTPEWGELLQEAAQWDTDLPKLPLTGMLRNLAEEYLYRYWLQGVDDGDCVSRMILLAVNALVVRYLAQVKLAKIGTLTTHDLLRLFQLYAKEVEHDEVNRERLLELLEGEYGLPELAAACRESR